MKLWRGFTMQYVFLETNIFKDKGEEQQGGHSCESLL